MSSGIGLEFRKMRRLHTLPLLIGLVVAVAALSSASLFSGSTRDTFDDPTARPWAALLLSYTMMAAMTSPTLAATAGRPPGALCRAKLSALAILLLPAVAAQSLLVLTIGLLVGIHAPVDVVPWAVYTVLLYLVDVAFCALHIWLAAQVENQLVSVGIGMLGAFLAVFSLLMPSAISKIIPWGYYAVISHARQDNGDITYMTAPYGWVIGFLVLVAVVFLAATRRLNRVER